ncbi:NAD(P)-dependent oxidoreductase [Arthrobacter sulfonylureivorans]|uniref:NAD(P)-dependent oxidoreductase n=1 Tax=Arthrobacter TaxID=1663 RepID=UPI0010AD30F4|nr:NAD(P)-dependent oxidoreductase [Arthrobacter sp. CAU 1506]TJY66119.1 NAD(P)-dependent oxidoreductase [Arthrobacter sp. CAU 1506]
MNNPGCGLPSVGFIGLGNMGSPMSARLAAAGYRVTGFDLDPGARARLADAGGTAVESAADATLGADVVILMLPNSAVVEAVLAEPEMKQALAPGTTIVDMSSSDPLSTRRLAGELAAVSVILVDAPVSGGVKGAQTGKLTIMAGGPESAVAQIGPLLAHLGRARRAGEVGAGHALKAINNLLSATHLLATAEGVLAGERFGLEPGLMVELINSSSGRSGSTDNKYPNFILPETFDSGFGLRLMLKDMKIATDLARQLGFSSRLGEQAVALWEQAAQDLPPAADHTEIARWTAAAARAGQEQGE